MVSEADLMRKAADQPDPFGRVPVPNLETWERAKAEGARAEELMSAPAVCARPEWNVAETARLMSAQNVERLPVVDETDKLVGIVSRADVLKVYLRDDEDIAEEVRDEIVARLFPHRHPTVDVRVDEGVVTLTGRMPDATMVPLMARLVRAVDGVVNVGLRLEGPTS